MKKLIALLCVAALILVLSASALAARSPSGSGSWTSDEEEHEEHREGNDNNNDNNTPTVNDTTDTTDQTTWTGTQDADVSKYASETAKEIVSALNDDGKTVSDLVESGDLPATVTTEGGNTVNLSEYSFVNEFRELVLTDGTNTYLDDNGQQTPREVEITIEDMSGVTDLSAYLIMVIDPVTGEKYFIPLDETNIVDAAAGTFKVNFPCLGPYCVLQKV